MARPNRKAMFGRAIHAMRIARKPFTVASIAASAGISVSFARRLFAGMRANADLIADEALRGHHRLAPKARICPVLDEIARDQCLEEQRLSSLSPAATSGLRTQLARACKTCPHSRSRSDK